MPGDDTADSLNLLQTMFFSASNTAIVKSVVLVGLTEMHKTGCSGDTRLVQHVPSSS